MREVPRLEALVRGLRGRRVLVLADLVADEFVYGRVERISREAPVRILRHDATDVRLGGGANAVHNIRTLGGTPLPFGVVGEDEHGRKLRALLREKGIAARGVQGERGYPTPVKSRLLAGRAHSTKQQIVRLARYAPLPARSPARRSLERALRAFRGRVDGVLVSDYGCGLLRDVRALTGVQDFVAEAPLNLVYVADLDRMHGTTAEHQLLYSATDTGFVAQNVYLYCASAGLATVVRGSIDREALGAALGLRPSQRVVLAQSVGYPRDGRRP